MDFAYCAKKMEETTKKLEEIREHNFRETFEVPERDDEVLLRRQSL